MGQQKQTDDEPAPELIEAALEAQRQLGRAMHRLTASEWVGSDLTMSQLKALLLLDTFPALTIGQFACQMQFAKPAASILVDKLVQAGYVERTEDPIDRRRTNIQLSAEGLRTLIRLMRGKRDRLRAALARLSEDDLRALIQGFRALADSITGETDTASAPEATVSETASSDQIAARNHAQ
jgi:DNA-binding MarR family transcriptional regulator